MAIGSNSIRTVIDQTDIRYNDGSIGLEIKTDAALIAAYKVAVAEKGISSKEQTLLDKFAAKSDGEFSAAYQTASVENGISATEIAALNKLLGIEDSFAPAKK